MNRPILLLAFGGTMSSHYIVLSTFLGILQYGRWAWVEPTIELLFVELALLFVVVAINVWVFYGLFTREASS